MISKYNVCYVIVCFFFFQFLFLDTDLFITQLWLAFHRGNQKRDIFYLGNYFVEIGIRGKLARRDKLGSCFKCRETRSEEEMNEGKCISGIQ